MSYRAQISGRPTAYPDLGALTQTPSTETSISTPDIEEKNNRCKRGRKTTLRHRCAEAQGMRRGMIYQLLTQASEKVSCCVLGVRAKLFCPARVSGMLRNAD